MQQELPARWSRQRSQSSLHQGFGYVKRIAAPLDGEDSRFDGELYTIYLLRGWEQTLLSSVPLRLVVNEEAYGWRRLETLP